MVVDNLVTGYEYNIPSKVAFYHFDIRDPNIDKIFMAEKPDFVIHQAAQVSVQESVKKPFYGLSKLTSEAYIQLFAKLYGLKYTILRYSNVYGTRQNTDGEAGAVSIFIDCLLKNDSPIIYGKGNQTRDFIFVKDVAHTNFLALKNADNQICNISSNQQISVNELLDPIYNLIKIEDKRIYKEERPEDIIHSYLSKDKAKKYLDWQPKCSVLKGLGKTISFFNKE